MFKNPELIKLTKTEKATFIFLCCNLCVKQVAEKRILSVETIKGHCKSIRMKLGANTIATAIYRAGQINLLTEEEMKPALEMDWDGLK